MSASPRRSIESGFLSATLLQRVAFIVLVPVLLAAMVVLGVAVSRAGISPVEPAAERSGPVEHAVADDPGDANPVDVPEDAPTPDPPEEPDPPEVTAQVEPVEEPQAPPPPPPYDVAAVQQRLTDLRYYVGPIDGAEGPATRSAVMAFQKVNGLTLDGEVGATTLAALDQPAQPVLRDGPADRIEVDLNIQVLHLITDGELARTMPVSSGNGAAYTTSSGGTAYSLTPVGHFTIERRIRGVRNAPLGTLYDPLYFYRGWAIHGSNSVPPYPASHGCIRLTRADAVWLFDRAPNGMSVSIYGGQHTFPAGSAAPGTDTPAGDVPSEPEPTSPEPAPADAAPAADPADPGPAEPDPAPGGTPPPDPEAEPEPGGLLPPALG